MKCINNNFEQDLEMSTSSISIASRSVRELVHPGVTGSLNSVDSVMKTVKDVAKMHGKKTPRLVAVSKTHPLERVEWAYHHGIRHFGENYIQELHGKSIGMKKLGRDHDCIKWHFIGHIQRNKMKLLTECPWLWMVETVHKVTTADALHRSWSLKDTPAPLKVLIQVNTSGERDKLGCLPEAVCDLAQHIRENCSNLELNGLMTIGTRMASHRSPGANPDFNALVECRDALHIQLEVNSPLELSMGMSADYEDAIQMGSTSIRVGTAIFGTRGK